MDLLKYWYYKNEVKIFTYGFIIFFIILCIVFTSCRTSKIITQTKVETKYSIDTVIVNKNINTVSVVHDSVLVHDTIKVENQFSKVKVFNSSGKLKVELTSKPFITPVKIDVVKTEEKKEVARTVTKTSFGTFFLIVFISYVSGIVTLALILMKFKLFK